MMHHTHPQHHPHVHTVNVHPSQMHPQHGPPPVNINIPPRQQHHQSNMQQQISNQGGIAKLPQNQHQSHPREHNR